MEVVLFTYDRPHWKSERFLLELLAMGIRPRVYLQPWRELNLPESLVLSVKHSPRDPHLLMSRFGLVPWHPHDQSWEPDLGVIGGARILPVGIRACFGGILNIHPGAIPENRGLSNVCRAIRDGKEQVLTAHLVDERIDAGAVLATVPVEEEPGDTIYDLAERMMDEQVELMHYVVRDIMADGLPALSSVPGDCGGYEPPLTKEEELRILHEHAPHLLPRLGQ